MSSWEGKSRGGYLGHLFFMWVLKYLGLSLAYFFLRFVAAYFLFFSFSSVRSLLYLYRARLGYGSLAAIAAVYRNFYTFGQILLDKVSLFNGFSDKFDPISIGGEHLKTIEQMGRGGILICAHFGGWELSGHLMENIGFKPKILMLEAEHEKIKQVLEGSSNRRKLDIIPVKDDISHVLEVTRCLKNGDLVAIHGDRYLKGSRTIRLEFLGEKADFPLGPFAMAIKLDVPVSFIFTTKDKGFHYRCFASEVFLASEQELQLNQQQKIHHLANAYVRNLEEYVRKYPHQWFNYHDFWQE